jgi:site-specific DNA-methyltransferase (adenine-specific)
MTQPKVEVKTLDDLQPDPNNVNKHSVRGHQLVENSLRRRGAFRSVAAAGKGVEKPVVMAGNLTVEKARDAGFEEVIFVHTNGRQLVSVIRDDIEPGSPDAIALGLEDNESASKSYSPDIDVLAALAAGDNAILTALRNDDRVFDGMIEGMGLKAETHDAEPQVDRAAELLAKWQVQPGDLWQIGEHRLICGDCKAAATVARVIDGEKARLVITSPPYAEQRKETYGGIPMDKYVIWWDEIQRAVSNALCDDGSFFVNIKPHCEDGQRVLYVFDLVLSMVREWGWKLIDELCWVRQSMPNGTKYRFRNGFEPVYHFAKNTPFGNFSEMRQIASEMTKPKRYRKSGSGSGLHNFDYDPDEGALPDNVIMVNTGEVNTGTQNHPATFPVRLPEFFITGFSVSGDCVYEPFSGSGTTLVACENLGRRCRAIEISPAYVAVALERMSTAFPGIEIKRLSTETGKKLE